MTRILFFSFFLVFSVSLSAQSYQLSGKVLNKAGQAIKGAVIEVLNTNAGAVTDTSGLFSISNLPEGRYKLQVTAGNHAGRLADVQLPGQPVVTIVLDEAVQILDEVIVRAEKREERLQQVPLSVSSLSAKDISAYRLWNISQITGIVPTLYSADPGDNRNVTSVRGITSTSYDPAVATYIDGVNQFNLDLYMPELLDVERIEVLRGPQATLYGRNAMGGVINIITRQPVLKTTGFAEASVGNYGLQRYRAGVKTPLTNKLLAGAAFLYNRLNGYYQNLFNNTSYDKQSSFGGSYFLKYLPSAQWSLLLNVKHQQNRNNGTFPLVFGADAALQDPYKLSQNAVAQMKDNLLNASLAVNYSGSKFQLTSETGYQTNHRYYTANLDADFSPLDAIAIFNNYGNEWNKVKALTQELRISSPAGRSEKAVQWLGGTYLFYQRSPVKQATVFGQDAPLMGTPDSLFRIINTSTATNRGLAFFGQATVPLTAKLKLVGGLRYDYQKSELAVRSDYSRDDAPFTFPVQGDTAAGSTYHAFSPKAGLLYTVNAAHTVYINYSRGFRTGGLTPLGADPSQPALYPFSPEYSNNYEAGIKNTFFNNRLRLNLAAFYVQVSDIQVPTLVLPQAITITRNRGQLRSKGVEAELAAALLKQLSVQYNFGYTDAAYKRLLLPVNGSEKDFSGNKQIFTPDITSALAIQYIQPVNSKTSVLLRGEWFYLGTQYFDQANTIRQAPYHLLHTRAGIRHANAELVFWMRNITRTKYIDFAYDFGGVHLGDPQTYGLSFSVRFE